MRSLVRAALAATSAFEVVSEAPDGVTALAEVEEHRPDIVVLDLGLPDIAGRDVLTRLREQMPGVRVVLFTGSPDATKASAARWGAHGLVRKDEDMARLVRALEKVADSPLVATAELERSQRSPSEARRFVERTLADWDCDRLIHDASLVVSELVTNAITHADSPCRLHLRLGPEALRIEVLDTGPGSPEPQVVDHSRRGGRGLLLISAVASAWGIDPVVDGKVVWAELAA